MIPKDEHELTTDNTTKQCKNFMERVEDKILNYTQPLFHGTEPYEVYYSAFRDTEDSDNNILPYGENILRLERG